ncbi:MAG TPA: hypothetical protein VFC97_04160 [Verrucomicrobiae bacterium]|jgi:hypothetical protein|nr:hypothetical protein [Verrucomicrobiae bacterium]
MITPPIVFDQLPGAYRAGVCNIGPAEIARRRAFGRFGLAVSGLLALAMLGVGAPPLVRLLVALPVAGSVISLLQARLRFCAAFGIAGLHNFGRVGSQDRVLDRAARLADRLTALRIIVAGSCAGLAAGAILALIAR